MKECAFLTEGEPVATCGGRTVLPPQVQGEPTSCIKFFIEKIKI
jgi:hypothetical protein